MKNKLAVLLLMVLAAGPALAGSLTFSGRAGYYTPSGGSSSLMYGLAANYLLTPNLSVRGAVDTTTYTDNNNQHTFTPVTLDLIYSQTYAEYIHPYVGAGVSYNTMTVAGSSSSTSGAQLETGIRFEMSGFSAGVEYRYMLADLSNTKTGSSTFNGYATGAFTQTIPF
jgi:hypothetical protein